MNFYIHYSPTKLINFLLICLLFLSCKSDADFKSYQKAHLSLPSGEQLNVYLAISEAQQKKGLSHVTNEEFQNSDAMLFYGATSMPRRYWMPNTHFNLDIVFLSENFYVLDIHKNLEHFPSDKPRDQVPTSKTVRCHHVLELKANSPIASKIHPGMLLKWNSSKTLEQIISDTHQRQ